MSRPARPLSDRLAAIRAALLALDELCAGTLVHRTTVCGKPACRCATDPAARHGPYYQWSRLEHGRLVRTALTAAQARRLRRAIKNERRARALLARWGRETGKAILTDRNATD